MSTAAAPPAPAEPAEGARLVDVGDTSLHVVDVGEGPAVVVLHGGMGLDHTYLRRPLGPLTSFARVLFVDQRGNGRSPAGRPLAEVSMETWADDLDALCSALGLERVVLFGHSYGGFVALECGLRHADRVAGIILCGTAAAFTHHDAVLANLDRRGATPEQRRGFLPPSFGSDEEFRGWLALAGPLYLAPGAEAAPDLAGIRFHVETLRRGGEILQRWDRRGVLASLTVPALVLGGRHDFVMPVEEAMAPLAAGLPQCTSVVFEESGHFPFVEEPERFVEVVRNWMACLPNTADPRGGTHV